VVFVVDSHNPIVVGMDTDYIVVEEAEIAVEQANSIESHSCHKIWTQKQLEHHN
jgi:hypothetical protein